MLVEIMLFLNSESTLTTNGNFILIQPYNCCIYNNHHFFSVQRNFQKNEYSVSINADYLRGNYTVCPKIYGTKNHKP